MNMNTANKYPQRQRGVVLFISLIMLVVIGLLTMSLMGLSRIEMRMANNEESRISSLQMAQAMNDIVIARPAMTPVIGGAGFKLCLGDVADCDMEMPDMPVNDVTDAVDDGYLQISAIRQDPEFRPPPRGTGFSASKFTATSFRLQSTYDRTSEGQGQAAIEEGVIVLVPL
jgi:hypothetical protein